MSARWVTVTLGRMPIRVPMIVDEETTLRVAEKVNRRLEEIERKSDRVDTHAFALIAAMSFAAELEQAEHALERGHEDLEDGTKELTTEFFAELDKIAEALESE